MEKKSGSRIIIPDQQHCKQAHMPILAYLHPGVVAAVVSALVSCCTALLTVDVEAKSGGGEGGQQQTGHQRAGRSAWPWGGYQ
jgi:hypothetical protein